LEVNLNVAIDFTQSNGHPSEIRSLHRAFRPGQPENDYEKAIRAVGGVIEAYDKDKKFAVYGFGARIGQDRQVSHCFPVYGGESIVQGVEGVIHAYRDCVNAVELAGPTYFKHLIDNAGALAERMNCTQDNQKYTVLLILTDGVIDDMNETIASIVRASYLPLSIIIVGIGNEDFRDMGKLDGDSVKLAHGTVEAIRDIVQFVPFKKYSQTGPTVLAQNVLAEVPAQILKFMDMKKIKPNGAVPPPPAFDEASDY
jgi:vacuolar-type H+-ATPase subunit F/Vma7